MNVQNKVIVITGGAGGIGSAQAKLLARNGAEVWILDLVQEKIDQLVEELKRQGGKAHGAVADVTSEEEWKTIVERIVSESGRLDVVVNNAGINIRKPIEEMVKDEWMKMMEVNTASVFLATKYVLPVMRKQGGGAIINTSSICGLIGHMNTPEAYTATKGAITLLTKSVAARYGKDNIRCNSIHPATVDTPFDGGPGEEAGPAQRDPAGPPDLRGGCGQCGAVSGQRRGVLPQRREPAHRRRRDVLLKNCGRSEWILP